MSVVEEMNRLAERYAELEDAKEQVEDLLMRIEEIALPSGIYASHHSEMEWGDTLEQIESEMRDIENRVNTRW